MRQRLAALLVALVTLACPALRAQDNTPEMPAPEDIPPEIQALATDPLAGPGGAFPPLIVQPKREESPRSPFFYVLPIIGFWLILRRRSRGVRL